MSFCCQSWQQREVRPYPLPWESQYSLGLRIFFVGLPGDRVNGVAYDLESTEEFIFSIELTILDHPQIIADRAGEGGGGLGSEPFEVVA